MIIDLKAIEERIPRVNTALQCGGSRIINDLLSDLTLSGEFSVDACSKFFISERSEANFKVQYGSRMWHGNCHNPYFRMDHL